MVLDRLVHEWLGEHWLVDLVVAVPSVADDVDDDIALPLLAPLGGDLHDLANGLDVVTVDVKDRSVKRLGDIRAVRGGAAELGIGREGNLVVHNNVDAV